MTRIINFVVMAAFAGSLAACATPAPQADAQNYQPPRQQLDAKTQLETGRKYR
jgi:hypothetical protein